jgi:glutamine---fructose-6-phosphate transaminase (isomerizing)
VERSTIQTDEWIEAMTTNSEIFEQPDRLRDLLQSQRTAAEQIAAEIKRKEIPYVFLVARGTSDNAGRYANYLWGAHNQLPLALATPSLFTTYEAPPNLKNALVVSISQSGMSPDLISVVEEGKRQGCLTLSITNAPDSPLAKKSDFVLDIGAGVEAATAATKSYTGELLAVAMISAALEDDPKRWQDLERIPEWVNAVLELDDDIARMSLRYRYMQRCVMLGRGFNYCTAFEWALKVKELSYAAAEPYSIADFLHGPIAQVEPGFPVMAVAPSGKVLPAIQESLTKMIDLYQIELAVISDRDDVLELAQMPMQLPRGIPEWLSPIISIIPGQLFALHLTKHRGLSTEKPRIISKVTETT